MISRKYSRLLSEGRILLLVAVLCVAAGCTPPPPTLEQTLEAAEVAQANNDTPAAITLLEAYDERDPGKIPILEALAFAYGSKSDHTMAAFYFSRLAEVDPSQPEYLLYAAGALRQANDVTGAIKVLETYLVSVPTDKAVWIQLAESQMETGNRGRAIEAYLQANSIAPEGTSQVKLAQLFLRSNNLAQAQRWFATALAIDDEARADALLGLFETAVTARQFRDAEKLSGQIEDEFPGMLNQSRLAATRRQLSEWRQRQDEAAAAAAALTAAREAEAAAVEIAEPSSQPETPAQLPAQGTAQQPITQGPSAAGPVIPLVIDPTPVAEEPPPSAESEIYLQLLNEARRARSLGDPATATRAFRRALARDDRNPEIWLELSKTHYDAEEFNWAETAAREALRREPENPAINMHYLVSARHVLEPDALMWQIEGARRKFPQVPEFTLFMARAYRDLYGNRANAGRLFQEFLRQAPASHPQRTNVEAELAVLQSPQ